MFFVCMEIFMDLSFHGVEFCSGQFLHCGPMFDGRF